MMSAALRCECVVVGAGAVGLAVTRALALRGVEVVCLEAGPRAGEGVSSRSSEVVHAGLYYGDDLPIKRRCCVEGRERLYAYCEAKRVPYDVKGKLVVAQDGQAAGLDRLEALAAAAGVGGLARLGPGDVAALEPEVRCAEALLSPRTGVFDSAAYVHALLDDCEALGAVVATNHEVLGVDGSGALAVDAGGTTTTVLADRVVNAAGLSAAALCAAFGAAAAPATLLARGTYFALRGPSPFARLVYPLPDPRGGLGVHATVGLDGRARFGPDVEWLPPGTQPDAPDLFAVDEGRAAAFYGAVRSYYPALEDGALAADYAGVRPKLRPPSDGAADFCLLADGATLHLLGVESPGLTASLALAEEAADAALGLPRR